MTHNSICNLNNSCNGKTETQVLKKMYSPGVYVQDVSAQSENYNRNISCAFQSSRKKCFYIVHVNLTYNERKCYNEMHKDHFIYIYILFYRSVECDINYDSQDGLCLMQVVTEPHHREKRFAVDEASANRMKSIMTRKYQTNKNNCAFKKAYELFLPGDVNYGK